MQQTSALYKELISLPNHWFESRLVVGYSGDLITENAERILIGGDSINIGVDNAQDGGYGEDMLFSLSTTQSLFSEGYPVVGSCVSAEIDFSILRPAADFKPMAELLPYVRVTDGTRYSEWLSKGVFYIDTRETSHNVNDLQLMKVHGYDSMLKAERSYPEPADQLINWTAYNIGSPGNLVKVASQSFTLDQHTIDRLTALSGETVEYNATVEGVASGSHSIGDVDFVNGSDEVVLSLSVGDTFTVTDELLTAVSIIVYGSTLGAAVYGYTFANVNDTVTALNMVTNIVNTLNDNIPGDIGESDIRRLHLSDEDKYLLRHPDPTDRPEMGSAQDVDHGYRFNYIASSYSCREVLSMIGAAYCANWFIDEQNYLRLAVLNGYPTETSRLIDSAGYWITFGGDYIDVG